MVPAISVRHPDAAVAQRCVEHPLSNVAAMAKGSARPVLAPYNLHTNDMSVEYMRKLSKEDLVDMMKKAGIDNMVHQQKIFEALCSSLACDLDQLQSDEFGLCKFYSIFSVGSLNVVVIF